MSKLTLVLGCLAFALSANGAEPPMGNRFAADLYSQLAADKPGNLVASPFSIHTALSMVAAGAAGNTEAQMLEVLALPADRAERAAALKGLLDRVEAIGAAGDLTLDAANRVWVQEGFTLLPEFIQETEAIFGAGFAPADFAPPAEAARDEINNWVKTRTREKIKDVIPPTGFPSQTCMVLVNAVYFYGAWETPFQRDLTRDLPFHLSPEKSRSVPMMHARQIHIGYRQEAGLQVCELPYRGGEVGMVFLLPAAGGLEELEARVSVEGLDAVIGDLKVQAVQVTVPRFKIETGFRMNETLAKLGMTDAFGAGADFSGMTGTRGLHISEATHKAVIEVNEEGTEAAAATVMFMQYDMANFRADRPFLFVLRDRTTGTVLFLGRVVDPGA